MPRVMISYHNANQQREFALALEKELTAAGIKTWIDVKDIPPLSRREDKIFNGIVNSDYVILCLSPEYFASETCRFESYIARGHNKHILPIIVPHHAFESVLGANPQAEERRGIDYLNFLDFHTHRILGLQEDRATFIQRLIQAITNPTAPDIIYDVFFSFRWSQAAFATRVSDDLNKAGINSFIHTRAIDVGTDWRKVSWDASLSAKIHVVVLSPDMHQSEYIKHEVLDTLNKKDTQLIPLLPAEFVNDDAAKSIIRKTLSATENLAVLNEIQWAVPNADYEAFITDLINDIQILLAESAA